MINKDEFFIPKNAKETKEYPSPSGDWLLRVTWYKTVKGAWDYTQGMVFRRGSDTPIAEVRRNYSVFSFEFIEDHPNGHPYLICGEDYQGQTVIELDTGKRRDFRPPEAKKGHGFCWAAYRFEHTHQMLIVSGCYWAAPSQFQFFDFSDPIESGWPQIHLADKEDYIDDFDKWPVIKENGHIVTFDVKFDADDDDNDDDNDNDDDDNDDDNGVEPEGIAHPLPCPRAVLRANASRSRGGRTVVATKTYERQNQKLVLVHEWISEEEKQRRADVEERNRKYKEWLDEFRSTDPFYLTMLEELKNPVFGSAERYFSIGRTYEGWCPNFTTNEKRACKRIFYRNHFLTIDLEWGVETGPIKLAIFRQGNHKENKFFEHSVDAMKSAFAYAKELIAELPPEKE